MRGWLQSQLLALCVHRSSAGLAFVAQIVLPCAPGDRQSWASWCHSPEPVHRGALPTAESGINQHQRLQEKSGRDGVEQIVEENSVCLMLTHTHGPKCLNKAVGGGGEGRDFGGTLVQNDSDVVHSGAARATPVCPSACSPFGMKGTLLQRSHSFANHPPPSKNNKIKLKKLNKRTKTYTLTEQTPASP